MTAPTHEPEHLWRDGEVFVFGSNLRGAHGAGAAKDALELHGAITWVGRGRMGRCYALPTKDEYIRTLALDRILAEVNVFLAYAVDRPDERFFLTRVGCGLAGYTDSQIAPMFVNASPNVRRPPGW